MAYDVQRVVRAWEHLEQRRIHAVDPVRDARDPSFVVVPRYVRETWTTFLVIDDHDSTTTADTVVPYTVDAGTGQVTFGPEMQVLRAYDPVRRNDYTSDEPSVGLSVRPEGEKVMDHEMSAQDALTVKLSKMPEFIKKKIAEKSGLDDDEAAELDKLRKMKTKDMSAQQKVRKILLEKKAREAPSKGKGGRAFPGAAKPFGKR